MDPLKLENFSNEYPDKHFPRFRTLSVVDAEKIREIIASKLNMSQDSSSLELVKSVKRLSSVIPSADAESDNFELKSTLINAGISPNGEVFINWYRFDQIDSIDMDDLSVYFSDIWYPAVDHIDIFDNSLSWMASVDYSGVVSIVRFDN